MRTLVFLNGVAADSTEPQLYINDLGLLRGDGVFETVLVSDGQARELEPHLARLANSAALLDLPQPDLTAWRRTAQLVIEKWQGGPEFALKLVYTRGVESDPNAIPTGFALGEPIPPKILRARADGLAAITLERGIDAQLASRAPWLLLGAKSLSYATNMAAIREANRRGAGDVIFTATDGSVLEGPTSTVVIARGRTLLTPPASAGILPGTTQAALFRGAERAGWTVKLEPLWPDDLRQADGIFLTSSVRRITRVHTLDGVALADSTEVHTEIVRMYDSEYA